MAMELASVGAGIVEKSNSAKRSTAGSSITFFNLPLEIRQCIYRLLLAEELPIWIAKLHPAILCTCRQIYEEARPILYRENTFQMHVAMHGNTRAAMLGGHDLTSNNRLCAWSHTKKHIPHIGLFPLQELRRFEVRVYICCPEVLHLRVGIQRACRFLDLMPQIHRLDISLINSNPVSQAHHRLLGAFGVLRNIGEVTFSGVPQDFAEALARKMTDPTPRDRMTKKYDSLCRYAKPFKFLSHVQDLLEDAQDSSSRGDEAAFDRERATVIKWVTDYMEHATASLFDYDGGDETAESE